MKQILAMFCLILVLGCTGGAPTRAEEVTAPGTERSYGVKIINFEPDLAEVSSLAPLNLIMQVKNVGNYKATEVTADLYKVGAFTNPSSTQPMSSITLEKVDTELNQPGESAIATWGITAPAVSTDYSYPLGVRLKYKYGSEGRSEVVAMTRDRLVSLKQKGEALPVPSADSSIGPIEISVQVPELVIGETSATKTISVKILLQNIGDGIAKCNDGKQDCIQTLVLTPSGGGVTVGTCTPAAPITLIGGKNAYVTCPVTIPMLSGTTDEITSLLKATATYTYQTEAETTVTVAGAGVP